MHYRNSTAFHDLYHALIIASTPLTPLAAYTVTNSSMSVVFPVGDTLVMKIRESRFKNQQIRKDVKKRLRMPAA